MLVSLAAPRGIHKHIYPWGLELVADFLSANTTGVDITKINMSADSNLDAVFPTHNKAMNLMLQQMRFRARQVFLGSADFISSYTAQVAAMGDEFIAIAETHDMLKPRGKKAVLERAREEFPELKKKFDAYLEELIRKEATRANGGPHIWGITSYDHTVFNVLYFAQKISEVDPEASIILGGDYWDFHNARTLIENLDWIDGVVVGYGEQTMVDIINRVSAGEDIRTMAVKGLTNRMILETEDSPDSIFVKFQDIRKADEGSGQLQTMNVPDAYVSETSRVPFKLVHRDLHRPNVYRVLTQRGCSFGGCRFCTQIDRMIHFPFSIQEVTRQFQEELDTNPPTGAISISIDNDEMTGPDLLYLVNFFENLPYKIESVVFWYQVKLFNAKIAAGLNKSRKPGIYKFQMNWESMNPKTLRFMSKGHDPLKAIEAAKSVLDVGAGFTSNYMCRFPRQDSENVEQEAQYLAKAFHLAVDRLTVFSYSANGRDLISNSPERYQMDVTRNPASVWSKQSFGTDLDISFWQYDWVNARGTSDRFDHWISNAYGQLFKRMGSYQATFVGALNHVPLAFLCLLSGRLAYIKRSWVLFNIMERNRSSVSFALDGNRLTRQASIFGVIKNLDILLDDQDIALLRLAYWTVRESKVIKMLTSHMTDAEAQTLLNKHDKLGTILRIDGKMISVVNDPGYWALEQVAEKNAATDTALAINFA